jgi:hypothetical protein
MRSLPTRLRVLREHVNGKLRLADVKAMFYQLNGKID